MILFEEFSRQKKLHTWFQYPDDHYDAAFPKSCLYNRLAPSILHRSLGIPWPSVEWFFQSIAAFFPCVMILSSELVFLQCLKLNDRYEVFLQKVRERRPRYVLHAVNAPSNPSQDLQGDGYHWILFFMVSYILHLISKKTNAVGRVAVKMHILHQGSSD